MTEHQEMKTGTTTVGLKCRDGIVLAADMRATSGNFIVNKSVTKIHKIADTMAVTMAGTVSDAMLLVRLIQAEIRLKNVRTIRETSVKEAANLLSAMVYANIRKFSLIPGISHFLLGGKDDSGYYLYDIFADGSLTEVDDYVSSGSGSVFAYGVLETLFKPNMSTEESVNLAKKAITAALQRDSASGGGVQVSVINKDGFKVVFNQQIHAKLEIE